MTTKGYHCEVCDGMESHGETDDELVKAVQDHIKEEHDDRPQSREQILTESHDH